MIMSVSTLTIRSGAATPSNLSNLSISASPKPFEWRLGGRRSRPCLGLNFALVMAVVCHLRDLDIVHLVIFHPAELLRLEMLRMHPPGRLAFLVLELDDGDPLAVIGPEAFVRDVARNGLSDLLHALDQRDVCVLQAGAQAGPENGDDHDGLLICRRRHCGGDGRI